MWDGTNGQAKGDHMKRRDAINKLTTIIIGKFMPIISTAGCATWETNKAQTFTLQIENAPSAHVLDETLRIQGQVDIGRGDSEQPLTAEVRQTTYGTISVEVDEGTATGMPLSWSYDYRERRITIFSPGFVAMTVYPERWTDLDPRNGTPSGQAVMGWRVNGGAPISNHNGLGLGDRFDPYAERVALHIRLRPLKAGGHIVTPPVFLDRSLPAELCDRDALTLGDQIRAVGRASKRPEAKTALSSSGPFIWEAIRDEYDALDQAGFGDHLPPRDDAVVRELKLALSVPPTSRI